MAKDPLCHRIPLVAGLLAILLAACTHPAPTATYGVTPTLQSAATLFSAPITAHTLEAAQALVSFPLLIPDPATLPPGLDFAEAQKLPSGEQETIALIYRGDGLELTVQEATLPAGFSAAPPEQPYESAAVRGQQGWLITLPTAPDLHTLNWAEDNLGISVSGNLAPDVLLRIAEGLRPLSEATPTSTLTVTPLPTATPTSLPTPTATSVPPGGILFRDDFSVEDPDWPQGRAAKGTQGYEDGRYRVSATVGLAYNWVTYAGQTFGDFVLEADASPQSPDADVAYGLVFRRATGRIQHYVFLVSNLGGYTLARESPEEWVVLQDWTSSSVIQRGGRVNHLKVVVQGSRIALFANGQFLTALRDPHPLWWGEVGFGVMNYATDARAHVLFDNLVVRSLDEAAQAVFHLTPVVPTPTPPPFRPSRILRPIPTPLPIAPQLLKVAHGATIHLAVELPEGRGVSGTGTVVGSDGLTALTAFHIVGDLETGQLYNDVVHVGPILNWALTARIVETAPDLDLAVVRVVPDGFPGFAIVPLGDSDRIEVGDTVYTLSYPGVGQGSLVTTSGVVLAVFREKADAPVRYILTDAKASPGSSGGVAINERGELIGIVTAIIQRPEALAEIGYPELKEATVLIPINWASPLLRKAMGQ